MAEESMSRFLTFPAPIQKSFSGLSLELADRDAQAMGSMAKSLLDSL